VSTSEAIGPFQGELHPEFDRPELRRWLARLPDAPGCELVSPGLQRANPPGLPRLFIKEFKAEARWKSRADDVSGRKGPARRSFSYGLHLESHQAPTPRPVAWLEQLEGERLLRQFLVTEWLPGTISFRDALLQHYYDKPLCSSLIELLQAAADAVRACHDAGLEHRDLGNQNLLVSEKAPYQAWVIDLHRGRLRSSFTPALRGKDSARIHLPSDFRRVFHEMLFAPEQAPKAFYQAEKKQRNLYSVQQGSHRLRHPFQKEERPLRAYPPEQDIWIWDDRSMQAIPALKSKDKRKYYRKRDLGLQAESQLRWKSKLDQSEAEILAALPQKAQSMKGRIGMGMRIDPERFEDERRWLEPLGPIPLILRLYHHDSPARRRYGINAIRRLQAEGHECAVALVQDRRAILFPEKWQAFVEESAASLSGFVHAFEVCHAINRVKWGIWNYPEYAKLLQPFQNWKERYPQIELWGPSGIDFEYPRLLPFLDILPEENHFQAFSHHLYVDRRGAPENEQNGYNTKRKLARAKAMARLHPRCDERLIISEVNWPLLGSGVWSPVGSPYVSPGPRKNDPSVNEEDYADYMERYLRIALESGLAERVYWWNLAAYGFGLIDDHASPWRPRPAYHRLKEMLGES